MRKLLLVFVLMMLTATITASSEEGHGDMGAPSKWAIEDISYAENRNMLDGIKPSWKQAITREQFCILSFNMLDCSTVRQWDYTRFFTDTDNEKISALHNDGIISGRGNGIFDAKDTITREEAATILYNLSTKMGIDTDSILSTLVAYADDDKISQWAKDKVYNMRKINVMNGTDAGFLPKDNITVEQTVSVLVRLCKYAETCDSYTESFSGRLDNMMPDNENYVISPFSIKLALLMAANGADGETRQEICQTIGVDKLEEYNLKINELISKYSESELLKLDVSNSIWINTDKTEQEFSQEYKSKVQEIFFAEADTVTDNTAEDKINGWVKEKTKGKISKIINEENTDFWAMLINAVYFKGRWVKEFSKELTKPDIFTDKNGTENRIDFMNKLGWMSYGNMDGVEIVELPYLTRQDIFDEDGNYVETKRLEDVDISMYFIMSDNEPEVEKAISSIEMTPTYIQLSLPKFKVEYSKNLADDLKGMGINKAFTPDVAEFSKMFTKNTMWITSLIHKTYINVDEEGTEAAAVTAVGMAGSSLPPEPIEVKFNKPFSFVIRDNSNDEILFMGRYAFGGNS